MEHALSKLYIPDSLRKLAPKLHHKTWPHPYNEDWTICFSNGYNGEKPRRAGENLVCYFCQPRNNVSFVQRTKHHLGAVPKLLKMNSALCSRQTTLTENSECSLCMCEFKISSRQFCFVAFFFKWTFSQILSLSADSMRWFFVSTSVSLLQFLNQSFSIVSPSSLWALWGKRCFLLFRRGCSGKYSFLDPWYSKC